MTSHMYIVLDSDLKLDTNALSYECIKLSALFHKTFYENLSLMRKKTTDMFDEWNKMGNKTCVIFTTKEVIHDLNKKYNYIASFDCWCVKYDSHSIVFSPTTLTNCPKELFLEKKEKVFCLNLEKITKIKPHCIVARCNQGQKKSGVEKGGDILLSLFKGTVQKSFVDLHEFNTLDGYSSVTNLVIEAQKHYEVPVTLGGDHSLGLATVSGSLVSYNNNVLVIWIDAHGDINTPKTSPTGSTHGMPVAGLMRFAKNTLIDSKYKLDPKNIIYYGVRDLDMGEIETIAKHGIHLAKTLDEVYEKINKYDNVHISFDVDSIDPKIMPCTGVKADNGINPMDAKAIIEYTLSRDKLVALDVVELNPDIEKESLDSCVEIVADVIAGVCL